MDVNDKTTQQPEGMQRAPSLDKEALPDNNKSFRPTIPAPTWSFASLIQEPQTSEPSQEEFLQPSSFQSIFGGASPHIPPQDQPLENDTSHSISDGLEDRPAAQDQASLPVPSIFGGYSAPIPSQDQSVISTQTSSFPSIFGAFSNFGPSTDQSTQASSFGASPASQEPSKPLYSIFGGGPASVQSRDEALRYDAASESQMDDQAPPSEDTKGAGVEDEIDHQQLTAESQSSLEIISINDEEQAENDIEDDSIEEISHEDAFSADLAAEHNASCGAQEKESLFDNEDRSETEEIISPEDAYFAELEAERLASSQGSAPKRSIRDLGIIINSKLRSRLQGAQRGQATAYFDQDDSGTYDPSLEGRRARRVERTAKKARVAGSNGEPRISKERSGIPVGYGFPMTFRLTSEKGLAYLRSITPDDMDSTNGYADDELSFGSSDDGYAMRRSKRVLTHDIYERDDGLTLDQLTIGHPQRRGCKSCFHAGDDQCSLISDPLWYPCDGCEASQCICELIIPPELKKVCERCKAKRIACSYRKSHGKGVDACEQCVEDDEPCVAGPLKSILATSNRIDDVLAARSKGMKVGAASRRYVSCHACRSNGLKCSLKKGEMGPCTYCSTLNSECTFESTKKAASGKTATVKQESYRAQLKRKERERRDRARKHRQRVKTPFSAIETLAKKKRNTLSHRASKPSSSPEPGNATDIRNIKTCFCYPITFNFEPSNSPSSNNNSCHWCPSPFFGLCGYGERTVQLTTTLDPDTQRRQTIELAEGHADQGREPSNMCINCTFSRLRILTCVSHSIHRIPNLNPQTFDHHALYKSLAAYADGDSSNGSLAHTTPWCSICPAPAFFQCGTHQEMDDVAGCGLLLCEACAHLLTRLQRGYTGKIPVLDRLVDVALHEVEYESGVRADAGFLCSEGEMMRALRMQDEDKVEVEDVGDFEEDAGDIEEDRDGGNAGDGKEVADGLPAANDNDSIIVIATPPTVERSKQEKNWGVGDFVGIKSRVRKSRKKSTESGSGSGSGGSWEFGEVLSRDAGREREEVKGTGKGLPQVIVIDDD